MEGRAGKQGETSGDAAAVIVVVENEAESMPVHEEESEATGHNYLDTCPVCLLNFHSREPKLLPCLHSFCRKCLPSPSRNLAMTEPLPHSQQADRASKPRESLCLQTNTRSTGRMWPSLLTTEWKSIAALYFIAGAFKGTHFYTPELLLVKK